MLLQFRAFIMGRTRLEIFSAYVLLMMIQSAIGLGEPSGVPQAAVVTASTITVFLTQFVKWTGLPDRRGPIAVFAISLIFTALLAWSQGNFGRQTVLDYAAVFANILLGAAGVYGFTRAAPEAVSSFTKPPNQGAGNSPTTGGT
jgi:multisubunit Na+/H+ antiporter MnhB subunit